jgi:phage repressor protein C with HTH and peptisase S24 domain
MRDSTTDRFLQNSGINPEWWKDGRGDMFLRISHKKDDNVYAVGGQAMLADQAAVTNPVEYVNPGDFLKKATGTLRVYGNSAFPKYPSGSIVAFKETKSNTIHYGEDYVIELEDRRIIKRVQRSKKEGHIQVNSYKHHER